MKTQNVPIGAKVSFLLANRPVVGRVLQDRGPIGIGGRHLYLVRYELGKGNWYYTEVPAVDMNNIEYKPVNIRKRRKVDYIIPVETVEAHSLLAKPEHAKLIAAFLRSHDIRFTADLEAFQGEINILIDKSTPWEEFVDFLNEWKQQYSEVSDNA